MTLCAYYVNQDGSFFGLSDLALSGEKRSKRLVKPTFGCYNAEFSRSPSPVGFGQKTFIKDNLCISYSGDQDKGESYFKGIDLIIDNFDISRMKETDWDIAGKCMDNCSIIGIQRIQDNSLLMNSTAANPVTIEDSEYTLAAIGSGSNHFVRRFGNALIETEGNGKNPFDALYAALFTIADYLHDETTTQNIVESLSFGGWFELFGNLTGNIRKYDIAYGKWLIIGKTVCPILWTGHKYINGQEMLLLGTMNKEIFANFRNVDGFNVDRIFAENQFSNVILPWSGHRTKPYHSSELRLGFDIEIHDVGKGTQNALLKRETLIRFTGDLNKELAVNPIFVSANIQFENGHVGFIVENDIQMAKTKLYFD